MIAIFNAWAPGKAPGLKGLAMRKATVIELRAAHHDPRQLKLSLPEPPPQKKPDVLLKWRWLNRYFDRHIYLCAGGGEHVRVDLISTSAIREYATAIAYRHTVRRVVREYRATEERAEKFLDWCGLQNQYLPPIVAKETLERLDFILRRKRGAR